MIGTCVTLVVTHTGRGVDSATQPIETIGGYGLGLLVGNKALCRAMPYSTAKALLYLTGNNVN